MKISNIYSVIIIYFIMIFIHYFIWQTIGQGFENIFVKYYLYMTILFFTVITVLIFIKGIYPDYVGFAFMGLLMFKLAIVFIMIYKLKFTQVPNYQLHFIPPYLILLILETLFAIGLIKQDTKDEKNQ